MLPSLVRDLFGVSVLTYIHQAAPTPQSVVVLQIHACLCRQTVLLVAAARAVAGNVKVMNVRKGLFLAPLDMA